MEKEFLPGDTILAKGSFSSELFFIKHGKVKMDDGNSSFFLSENDFFGEEGCFFNKPSSFTVMASEETSLDVMDSAEAETFLTENGAFAFRMFIKSVADKGENKEPLSIFSPEYMRLVAGILPYIIDKNGENLICEAAIDLPTLAAQIEFSESEIVNLLNCSKDFGLLYLSEGKILSCGKAKLTALFKDYNRREIFAGIKGTKGLGNISFFNIVCEKTNI